VTSENFGGKSFFRSTNDRTVGNCKEDDFLIEYLRRLF
jgi:hypothetical protein